MTLLLGDEPIYKDNELMGYVTSTKYGYSIGKWVCLAIIEGKMGISIKDSWKKEDLR